MLNIIVGFENSVTIIIIVVVIINITIIIIITSKLIYLYIFGNLLTDIFLQKYDFLFLKIIYMSRYVITIVMSI